MWNHTLQKWKHDPRLCTPIEPSACRREERAAALPDVHDETQRIRSLSGAGSMHAAGWFCCGRNHGSHRSQHGAYAQQHIAQLTDGGVGQPLFEAVFFIGQQRTHEHREQNHAHKGDLHPGALQEGSAHKLEHQPHHAQHTALGDDAG